ncbi:amidohydrolase [Amycolatopsis sp. CA-230715]|uniref:amidohydrolase n=1 Tax=Amycolatopsis sp. CA-230715 TaxID=2745196 RepID=UPI001C02569D|nr:amidohydrolase [Amycolatopsis sp. CA-230715]QWF86041.1 N-substituted formamide deformylase [Amycolatopsis sp. CA-230715]
MSIETVYTNGKVVTVDREFSLAAAFAVRDGVFTAVGGNDEVSELAGAGARVVDLGGQMVLPGFVDAHAHSVYRGIGDAAEPSLADAVSVADIVARIGEAAAHANPGAWIVTSPIGEPPDFFGLPEGLAEGRWPTRDDLDAVAADNPVCVPTSAYWPHPSVFNSAALTRLGVTRDTPEEPGVRIVRDAAGEPTGVIHGLTFYNPSRLFGRLMSLLPGTPGRTTRDAIARALTENIAVGVTSVYEGHGNTFTADLRALRDAGRLACRVVATYEVPVGRPDVDMGTWLSSLTDAAGEGSGDDLLKVVGVTVSLDGPTHFGRSAMSRPYLGTDGELGNGSSRLSTVDLADLGRLAVRHNLRLNVVASGDAGCGIAVDALEAVHRETPLTGRRWVAQHFHHATREQIGRLAAMGFAAQVCAGVDYARGEEVYVKRLPGDLWEHVSPLRWWIDAGVPIALASDGAHYDPMFQLWAALRRIDARSGRSLLTPAKTVTREEAIRAYTAGGAAVLGSPGKIGSIETGKLADFVVLDRDILDCPVDEIRRTRVISTVLGGAVVHEI